MAKLLDPVCGMTVDDTALRADGYDDVAFCAPGCRKSFLDNPDAFTDRLDTTSRDEATAGGCGCGHDANAQHTHAADVPAGRRLEMVEANTAPASGSGCCGGHGH